MSHLAGIVVIGRNEGDRLVRSLQSSIATGCPVVYVDSGSRDGSADAARAAGVDVLELDPGQPFSAARARNEGFARMLGRWPDLQFVQFLDGDCFLLPGWIDAAILELSSDARRAAVIGRLFEREAHRSAYNRLCAMEWRRPLGELRNCADLFGIMMVRTDVFRQLGGYRPQMVAGEDPELGIRIGLAGYKIFSTDAPMATHDANITSFRQWWMRAVRAGHAIGQRFDVHGRSPVRDCVRERNSTLFWGIVLPCTALLGALATHGASLLLMFAYPLLWLRVWFRRGAMRQSARDAALYANFVLIAKFANAVGLVRFMLNKLGNRYQIIEYK